MGRGRRPRRDRAADVRPVGRGPRQPAQRGRAARRARAATTRSRRRRSRTRWTASASASPTRGRCRTRTASSSPTTRPATASSRGRCPAAASCTRSASSRAAAAAGVTWIPGAGDRRLHSRSVLIERMATLLGGRVAEEIVFGEAVRRRGQRPRAGRRDRAPDGHRLRDERGGRLAELRRRDDGYDGVHVLRRHRAADRRRGAAPRPRGRGARAAGPRREQRTTLERIAEALLERETLTLDDVVEIAGPAPVARA